MAVLLHTLKLNNGCLKGLFLLQCTVHGVISQAESNMNDLISEYQQYQEATIDDDEYDGEGDDLEQDEA